VGAAGMTWLKKIIHSIVFGAANSDLGKTLARLANRSRPPSPVAIRVGDHTFFSQRPDRILALYLLKCGANEDAERKLFASRVKKDWTVIDIGANLGCYALLASDLVGDKGNVIAFEPDAENFLMLERAIQNNGITNVSIRREAVSDLSGPSYLYLSAEHGGDHSLYDPGEGRIRQRIDSVRLDDVIKPGERVHLIKMDIQGSETKALRGMSRVIQENPDLIMFIEFSPEDLRQAGSSADEFWALIKELGFKADYIDEKNGTTIQKSFAELVVICGQHGYVNLFCHH
jgi:FkbM family methyltransferase